MYQISNNRAFSLSWHEIASERWCSNFEIFNFSWFGKIVIFWKRTFRSKLQFLGFRTNESGILDQVITRFQSVLFENWRKRKNFNDIALKCNKMNQISIFFNKFLVLLILGLASCVCPRFFSIFKKFEFKLFFPCSGLTPIFLSKSEFSIFSLS